jgi:hypothetical protein
MKTTFLGFDPVLAGGAGLPVCAREEAAPASIPPNTSLRFMEK